MAALHTNNFSTTISAPLTAGATSLTLTSATGLPTPTGGNYFTLTLDNEAGTVEIVKVTARTGTTCTIVRAQEGTSDLNWPALTLIEQRLTAATIDGKISQLADDTSPNASANIDMDQFEIIDCLQIRTAGICKDTDNTNRVDFTTSRQTFKPSNTDVMNLTTAGMQLGGANSRVTTIYNTNTLSQNSATALATQASIKAYVDSFANGRAKAWATYDQSVSMSVLSSFGISSISDAGVGLAVVTLSTAMANTNYVVVAMGSDRVGGDKPGPVVYTEAYALTTTTFSLTACKDTGDARDLERISFVVFGV